MFVSMEVLEPLLTRVAKPSRYSGGELNAIVKDPGSVAQTWAFAFPDLYDLGMNNMGMQILYHVLNREPDLACERVFAPWPDMEALLRARGIPLFTLENRRTVRSCDVFAFTIPYEIILSNVVNMIDLAGLPLLSRDRDGAFPLVIGGGAIATNPEPIADFFDAFVVGEGEEVVRELSRTILEWKRDQLASGRAPADFDKRRLLERLTALEGVYVPAFFEPVYQDDGRLKEIVPLLPGYKRTLRRIIADLDTAPYPTAPVVPSIKTIHDRYAVEIFRGCMSGCRFCQAGMITRPTRERSPDTIVRIIDEAIQNTGYQDLSLNSLSSGDYSCINSLLQAVNDRYESQLVSVSVPSLRVKTLTQEVATQVARVKKGGFTIAPEAGSQRMRDAINKNVTEAEIERTVETIFQNGGQGVKLYFMCGLPGETDDDLDGIVHLGVLAWQAARKTHARPNVTVNVSSFVPKVSTPYQWAPQISRDEVLRKQARLREKLKPFRQITFRYHYDYGTYLEGIFSRGDRRLSRLLIAAQRLGCRFDGWGELIQPELWEKAYAEAGIDPDWYLRERALDEVLPWDHIETRVSKKFLRLEWFRHLETLTVPDCRWGTCAPCGACHKEVKVTTFDGQDPRRSLEMPAGEGRSYRHPSVRLPETLHPQSNRNEDPAELLARRPWQRVRLQYTKVGPSRFIGHLELVQVFVRALRRLGVQLRFSQGYHPMPRIVFSNPLPIGVESRLELVDLDIVAPEGTLDVDALIADLNDRQLPEGLHVVRALPPDEPLNALESITFSLRLPGELSAQEIQQAVARFHQQPTVIFEKRKGQRLDLKSVVLSLAAEDQTLRVELATPRSGSVKATEVLEVLFPRLDPADVRVVKEDCRFAWKQGGDKEDCRFAWTQGGEKEDRHFAWTPPRSHPVADQSHRGDEEDCRFAWTQGEPGATDLPHPDEPATAAVPV